MSFDEGKFLAARYEDRFFDVPVPDLPGDYFGEGEEKIIRVRGLTGEEIALVRQAAEVNAGIEQAVSQGGSPEANQLMLKLVEAILGTDHKVPDAYAVQLAMVRIGAGVSQQATVRLGRDHPIEFGMLFKKINELTGLGRLPLEK